MSDDSSMGLFRVMGIAIGVAMLLALETDWLSFQQYVALMLFMILLEVECLD